MKFFREKLKVLIDYPLIKKDEGFTLIEVLVVVTIIAVLSAITLISVGHYQDKADDVVIGVDLSQIRKITAMLYTDEHSYENICFEETLNDDLIEYPQLKIIENKIEEIIGADPDCFSVKREYCVQSELILGDYFCVDSTGFAGEISGEYCADKDGERNCSQ